MGKSFVVSAIVCLLLVSCAGQEIAPTSSPSALPQLTAAASSTATLTQPTELPPTSSLTPFPPYPNRKIIFEYYEAGNQSIFDPFFEQGFRELPKLVLYEDGLMILIRRPYMQKVLSPDEVRQFFSYLEDLGFYSLESNQKHDPTDKLYNYGDSYQKFAGGLKECVYAKADQERTLCVYEPHMQYLVPDMKRILHYLDGYEPTGLTPYYPDRVLAWVQLRSAVPCDGLSGPALTWNNDLPALSSLPWHDFRPLEGIPRQQLGYFRDSTATAVYLLIDGSPYAERVVTQGSQEYIVSTTVVLPHEKLTNAHP